MRVPVNQRSRAARGPRQSPNKFVAAPISCTKCVAGEDGHDLEDWLRVEDEITRRSERAAA